MENLKIKRENTVPTQPGDAVETIVCDVTN
jgi:hypothetical protein